MKSFIAILISALLLSGNGFAQNKWTNLQKYWWYRYQLVNDYLKIGDKCGESIPASLRHLDAGCYANDPQRDVDPKHLHWGDATISLGQYLLVLATEYRLLKNSGLSTNRTVYEIYYAIRAFDRLDVTAEARCRDFEGTKDCLNIKPVHGSDNNPYTEDSNGFFIRDDVPYSFYQDNAEHFNRAGVCNRVYWNQSDIVNRTDGRIKADAAPNGPTTWVAEHPNVPHYPVEMSQDQVTEIYSGLAMLVYQLETNEQYAGVNLKNLAKRAILRMSIYCAFPGPGVWQISNPLNGKCVYGISPNSYSTTNNISHCSAGGAMIFPSSPAVAKGLTRIDASWDPGQETPKVLNLWNTAAGHWPLYQVTKYLTFCGISGDQSLFPATFTAYAKEWRLAALFNLNVSRTVINKMSAMCDFRWPHLPLIYRLINGGAMFTPQSWPYNKKSYEKMLDEAPKCGLYNYLGNYANWEWSSSNRLAESYKRGETGANGDQVGLSYMEIFNLYLLNKTSYLDKMSNPYYSELFSQNFPGNVNGNWVGTTTNPYTYNTLEYLSSKSTIYPNSNVTFRNAKQIELLPGFFATSGATFTAYIKDYRCCTDGREDFPGKALPEADDPFVMDTVFMNDLRPTEIPVDSEEDYEPTPEEISQDSAATFKEIMESGDSTAITWLNDVLSQWQQTGNGPYRKAPSSIGNEQSDAGVKVYPNPTDGTITIATPYNTFDLLVYSFIGEGVMHERFSQGSATVNLSRLPKGAYILKISSAGEYRTVNLILR